MRNKRVRRKQAKTKSRKAIRKVRRMPNIKLEKSSRTIQKTVPARKLDSKTLQFYKKTLLDVKEKIIGEIKQISKDAVISQKDSSGDSGHALHMADVATDMYDREFSLGLASNDRELLYKVEAALQRIENRTFGLCSECSKFIPAVRLKAIPYAQTCLKCQEKLESH